MRTYGLTTNCAGCRFWSEMIAQVIGGRPLEAICLAEGPYSGKYVTERMTCPSWRSGWAGAVDDPPNYGEESRAAYAEEDNDPAKSVTVRLKPGRRK